MPTIFCQPINNLGNRLISIIGWYRLATLYGYDFVLVWPTTPDVGCFVSCYSDLFETPFPVIREMPHCFVHIPKVETIEARNYLTSTTTSGDIYVQTWHHFVYHIDEINKPASELTNSLRSFAIRLLRPSENVMNFGQHLGYHSQSFDLSLHWRGSAWLYNNWTSGTISTLELMAAFARTLQQQNEATSCFISSGDFKDGAELSKLLKDQFREGIFLSRAQTHEPSFSNHAIAVLDFMNLTRSKHIINSGITTFSALAAMVGMAILHTPLDSHKVYSRVPIIGSGLGI
jgi:hypothetical protein